jgi:hypothetical protein
MTPEQEEKLAALKGGYLANLAKVRQAANANKDERDRASRRIPMTADKWIQPVFSNSDAP